MNNVTPLPLPRTAPRGAASPRGAAPNGAPHAGPGAADPQRLAATAGGCPFTAFVKRSADAPVRFGTLLYGVVAYAIILFTILYAIGFVGNWIVPKSIDSGAAGHPATALLVNTALLLLFVVQHTVMARPAFKRWWTTIIPASLERSTFVIAASISLLLLFLLWQPLPATVWHVGQPLASAALQALSLGGWALVFYSSFVINHFDLFGLRQVWMRFRRMAMTPVGFRLRGPYRLVRHPLMVGFLIAFWSTPHMTVGHLFFAVMTTGYILMGTWFEVRDLVAEHGEAYLDYRRRVRGLLPIPRRAPQAASEVPAAVRPTPTTAPRIAPRVAPTTPRHGEGAAGRSKGTLTMEPYVP